MRANKADEGVMQDLRQWLQNPQTSVGAGMGGATEDLKWLQQSKDLSSVNLGASEKPGKQESSEAEQEKATSGGIASWFSSCAGKRK